MPTVSEMLAARLLVAYHLAHQRPMMGAFLDALGISHEDGIIAEEDVKPPSADALKKAAQLARGVLSRGGRVLIPVDADVAGPRDLGCPR